MRKTFPCEMQALGVLGGISAFDNAVQGALLGPILLSSIAVFFDLHVRLIAGLPRRPSSGSLPSIGRSRSASVESSLMEASLNPA